MTSFSWLDWNILWRLVEMKRSIVTCVGFSNFFCWHLSDSDDDPCSGDWCRVTWPELIQQGRASAGVTILDGFVFVFGGMVFGDVHDRHTFMRQELWILLTLHARNGLRNKQYVDFLKVLYQIVLFTVLIKCSDDVSHHFWTHIDFATLLYSGIWSSTYTVIFKAYQSSW